MLRPCHLKEGEPAVRPAYEKETINSFTEAFENTFISFTFILGSADNIFFTEFIMSFFDVWFMFSNKFDQRAFPNDGFNILSYGFHVSMFFIEDLIKTYKH